MRKLMRLFLALILLACVSSASALSNAERTYQIEVIVFSHITAQALRSEQWPWTPTNYIPSSGVINLGATDIDGTAFSLLSKNNFLLMPEQRQLNKQENYHVLLHLAWRQKIVRPRYARPIHIYGGNIYNASGSLVGQAEYAKQAYNLSSIWQVNGTITPTLIRYIDINMNLLFAQPLSTLPEASKNNNVQGRFAYFRLKQSRRMRSRELNYVGHPLYGVLIKVVPVS